MFITILTQSIRCCNANQDHRSEEASHTSRRHPRPSSLAPGRGWIPHSKEPACEGSERAAKIICGRDQTIEQRSHHPRGRHFSRNSNERHPPPQDQATHDARLRIITLVCFSGHIRTGAAHTRVLDLLSSVAHSNSVTYSDEAYRTPISLATCRAADDPRVTARPSQEKRCSREQEEEDEQSREKTSEKRELKLNNFYPRRCLNMTYDHIHIVYIHLLLILSIQTCVVSLILNEMYILRAKPKKVKLRPDFFSLTNFPRLYCGKNLTFICK